MLHPFALEAVTEAMPSTFPSPFDELGPHGVARRAAQGLMHALERHPLAATLKEPGGGKMFGVLVVQRSDGSFGVLHAFSGQWAGRWDVEGFVPPVFQRGAREAIEPAATREVERLAQLASLARRAPALLDARAAVTSLTQRQAMERAALAEAHTQRRADRHLRRAGASAEQLLAIDQESRRDHTEKRWLIDRHREEARSARGALDDREADLALAVEASASASRRLMRELHETYLLTSARGEVRPLVELFVSAPPSGAADCAGPRLLQFANERRLRPIAMAEFWWGESPPFSPRAPGAFAPSCREKCGPVMPFLLDGLQVTAPRRLVTRVEVGQSLPEVFRDEHLVIIDKPEGLLSVPGREASHKDSVLTRLQVAEPGARVVHRLDLDTSGLLVIALDEETHVALQQQFERREVQKHYVAVVEGLVERDAGVIDLALRGEPTDRPRQVHDPVHGKQAVTEWRVLSREAGRTRLELKPLTGRTHQLRVHLAHRLGLGAPIVGDRLYGAVEARLLLHAERLEFTHPRSGERLRVMVKAPF